MLNNHANNLNLLNILKSLGSSPCAGCIFFKIGKCSIEDVYKHYNNLDEFPSSVDNCNLKITHEDFSDFIIDDYFGSSFSYGKHVSYLCLILDDILNFKNSIKEEH